MESNESLESKLNNINIDSKNDIRQLAINSINVYPSDFVHGLLSAHVADETGCIGGKCRLHDNSKVTFSTHNSLYKLMLKEKNCNINNLLKSWYIEKILENDETGYCGIIYKNINCKNLVLAHRSTNFLLGTGSNLNKQSGIQTDYQSVLLGKLVHHIAFAHFATETAVEISKKIKYTLSITGHSLGSFLAELSIYYCYFEFNFKYVKAVVFDGPGCKEIMIKMNENLIENSVNRMRLEDMDITSYITAPNLVNCCNSHVRKPFTIFPKLEKDLGILNKLVKNIGDNIHSGVCATVYGHRLENILCLFDEITGKPCQYQQVMRWPKITHKNFGDNKNSLTKFLSSNKNFKETSVTTINTFYNNFLQQENVMTTLESIVHALKDLFSGKIDLHQFWNVHKLLNIENDFMKSINLNPIEEFDLIYNLHYQITPLKDHEMILNDTCDDIDRFLKLTKEKERELENFLISIENVVPFWKYYHYYSGLNQIKIDEKFTNKITVGSLRDYMRFLLLNHSVLLNNLTSSSKNHSFIADRQNRLIKINFIKDYYRNLKNIIELEKGRYPDENNYLGFLNEEEIKISEFLSKSDDDLMFINRIIMIGRTNSGKSTLGNYLLLKDLRAKIFITAAVRETFIPCKISIHDKFSDANIKLVYADKTSFDFKAENINNLIEIVSDITKKESKFQNKLLCNAEVISPRNFFPNIKSCLCIDDLPGYSENLAMKNLNMDYLAQEKHRSIIIFLIPLDIGGSLMKEDNDILDKYESKNSDSSNNIVFVLTKLKNFKTDCENANPDYSDEEVLDYMNTSIKKAFIDPLKVRYTHARIIISDVGREMEKYFFNKNSLLIKDSSFDKIGDNDIKIKSESMDFLNDYINHKFINQEAEYFNCLNNELLDIISNTKSFMFSFHSEDKNKK